MTISGAPLEDPLASGVVSGGRGCRLKELRVTRRNSTFQILQALKTNRAKRNELNEVFVEGIASIKAARRGGHVVRRIVHAERRPLSGWARSLIEESTTAQVISLEATLYGELCDREDPSEVIATFERKGLSLSKARLSKKPFVVVLDRPANHGNLGSIIRSANAFSVDLLIAVGHGVDFYDPAVIRSSIGSIFSAQICHVDSLKELTGWIETQRALSPGLTCAGTDSKGSTVADEKAPLERPVVLLLGNEAKGLSVELKGLADRMVRIPMTGSVDSLNVACAASILMYEVARGALRPRG